MKTARLIMRMEPVELEAWEVQAALAKLTLSEWVRRKVNGNMGPHVGISNLPNRQRPERQIEALALPETTRPVAPSPFHYTGESNTFNGIVMYEHLTDKGKRWTKEPPPKGKK